MTLHGGGGCANYHAAEGFPTSGLDGKAETTSGVTGEPQQQAGAEATIVYPSGFWDELSAALNRPPEMLRAQVRNIRARGYIGME